MGESSVGNGAPRRCMKGCALELGAFQAEEPDRRWNGDTGYCVSGGGHQMSCDCNEAILERGGEEWCGPLVAAKTILEGCVCNRHFPRLPSRPQKPAAPPGPGACSLESQVNGPPVSQAAWGRLLPSFFLPSPSSEPPKPSSPR